MMKSLEDYLLAADDEEIIWIKGRAFVVMPATDDDIERIGKGYFTLGYPEEGMKKRNLRLRVHENKLLKPLPSLKTTKFI